ncbi:glycosyltransferase family 4 protein [uncultured Croceitalea sp.]|uniref:glycosyltransferase family 4 protein n=1 Tax=uncultured Croceitalea sp. TaxID=1798908 RepID=UPI00374EF9E1
MKSKIRICLVGGEDAHKRIGISRFLIESYFEVTVLGSKDYSYPSDITFIKYNLNRSLNLISDFKTLLEYRRIFKNNNFDIIQTFDTKPAFLVPLSQLFVKVKIVRTITGLGTVFMSNKLTFRILRKVYILLHKLSKRKVAHTTFQNKDDWNSFLNYGLVNKDNSSLIYGSGIDLSNYSKFKKKPSEKFTFISIGRLVYEKGVVNYLEAAKKCIDDGYDFNFLLVGPLEENSTRLNKDLLNKYSKQVRWLGSRNDILNLLSISDVFVLPTFREGFSRVLLEASAAGIPSITTNVPGTREIIRDNKEGLLINVNNSSELAQAMINISLDKNRYNDFARSAKNHVKQFNLKEISSAYINLYNKIA